MKQNYLQNGHKNPLITKAKRHWNHSYTLPTDQKFIFSNEKVYKSQKNLVQKPSVRSRRMTALAHNASRSKKTSLCQCFRSASRGGLNDVQVRDHQEIDESTSCWRSTSSSTSPWRHDDVVIYVIMCVLAALGIVLTTVFLAVNIRFRHHR